MKTLFELLELIGIFLITFLLIIGPALLTANIIYKILV